MNRLTHLPTLRINPAKHLPLTYKGRRYYGLTGDTIATALYANRVRIFSRSFRYRRPRGLYSLDGECGNCLLEADGHPNVQAETALLRGGMTVMPQDTKRCRGQHIPEAPNQAFFSRKFYNMPNLLSFFHNPLRKRLNTGAQAPCFRAADRYDEQHIHTDVCVIGGGPAGMTAAMSAAGQGLRVVLMEARPWLGGYFDYRPARYSPGVGLYTRARELAGQTEATSGIRIFCHTFMTGLYEGNHITAFRSGSGSDSFHERYLSVTAKSIVVATGCIERTLLFAHNDLPGIMQVACAHRLARTYGLLAGEQAVFSVGDDLGLEAAADLSDLGIRVKAVADCRTDGQSRRLTEGLAERNIEFLPGWSAARAHGRDCVEKVTLTSIDGTLRRDFECDLLAASAGLTPCAGPLFLAQADMGYDLQTGFFLPKNLRPGIHAAGRVIAFHEPYSIEASGQLAGLEAAKDCGAVVDSLLKSAKIKCKGLTWPVTSSKLIHAPIKEKGKIFICFDQDVTLKDIYQSCDMGFDSAELAKQFTAAGTGPGQDGIPGHNLPLVISRCHAPGADMRPIPVPAHPPLAPVLLATYAGPKYDRIKRSPLYESHKKAGSLFCRADGWEQPRGFSQDETCREEIETVRNYAGLADISPWGKFRIFGPDAVKALQRIYAGNMSDMSSGKIKYSLMCGEDGCPVDEALIVKTGENDYYVISTASRADAFIPWFRRHSRYENWNFHIIALTDAFGAVLLAGPCSRSILQSLADTDISDKAFPYMTYRAFDLRQKLVPKPGLENKGEQRVPVRILRTDFFGELSYQIHTPSSYLQTVWDWLGEAGQPYRIRAFGTEAQNVLRLEKGHAVLGIESESRTTLHDLGLGHLWDRNAADTDTVGVPSLRFTLHQTGRLKLVGFKMDKSQASYRTPHDGALIVENNAVRGYVCTSRYSFTLKESIGLALVESHLAETGTALQLFEAGMKKDERLYAAVVSTPFYEARMAEESEVRGQEESLTSEYSPRTFFRRSPVCFAARKAETEFRDNREVVLRYQDEGADTLLIDLSHRSKWDIQDADLSNVWPGLTLPEIPGQCIFHNGLMLNRINKTRLSAWDLTGELPEIPGGFACTDVTDACMLLALVGKRAASVAEKVTRLDLFSPAKIAPFMIQGPVLEIPCQIAVLKKNGNEGIILIACAGAYAQFLSEAILDAGSEYGLAPAGEKAFYRRAGL